LSSQRPVKTVPSFCVWTSIVRIVRFLYHRRRFTTLDTITTVITSSIQLLALSLSLSLSYSIGPLFTSFRHLALSAHPHPSACSPNHTTPPATTHFFLHHHQPAPSAPALTVKTKTRAHSFCLCRDSSSCSTKHHQITIKLLFNSAFVNWIIVRSSSLHRPKHHGKPILFCDRFETDNHGRHSESSQLIRVRLFPSASFIRSLVPILPVICTQTTFQTLHLCVSTVAFDQPFICFPFLFFRMIRFIQSLRIAILCVHLCN
jgi:hypothetical protein